MNESKDFTIDKNNFPDLLSFTDKLQKEGLKCVIIMVCSNPYAIVLVFPFQNVKDIDKNIDLLYTFISILASQMTVTTNRT